MPWSNINIENNPFKEWNAYKLLGKQPFLKPIPILSILKDKNNFSLNVSVSIKVRDVSDTPHVLCVGINLEDALSKQMSNYEDFINEIHKDANDSKGDFKINKKHVEQIYKLSRILNIRWVEEAAKNPIDIISINNKVSIQNNKDKISWINDIKKDVIKSTK